MCERGGLKRFTCALVQKELVGNARPLSVSVCMWCCSYCGNSVVCHMPAWAKPLSSRAVAVELAPGYRHCMSNMQLLALCLSVASAVLVQEEAPAQLTVR